MNESNALIEFLTWANDSPLPEAIIVTVTATLILAIFARAWKPIAKVLTRVLPPFGRWIWSQRPITVASADKLSAVRQQETWDQAQAEAWSVTDPEIAELTRQLRVVTKGRYPLASDEFSDPPSDRELLSSVTGPAAIETKPSSTISALK